MMIRLLLSGSIAGIALLPMPASASPQGCQVLTIGNTTGACRYNATGPGSYTVATVSGFRIMASVNGGQTWTVLASKNNGPDNPRLLVTQGDIATTAGQLVEVDINVDLINVSSTQTRYQDGFASAGDKGAMG